MANLSKSGLFNYKRLTGGLVVVGVDFEIALGVEADGAYFGGFGADGDVSAVATFPDGDAGFAEYFMGLDVAQQCAIALFVMLLDGCHAAELLGKLLYAGLEVEWGEIWWCRKNIVILYRSGDAVFFSEQIRGLFRFFFGILSSNLRIRVGLLHIFLRRGYVSLSVLNSCSLLVRARE